MVQPRQRGLCTKSIKEQYRHYIDKNGLLSVFAEPVTAEAMYEDIFGSLDTVMPIFELGAKKQKIKKMPIADALAYAKGRNDILMTGTTFFHNFVRQETARNIYALIIDMDGVYSGTLKNHLANQWQDKARPTYIVNSGTGLHLYFVFDKPVPAFNKDKPKIKAIYSNLEKSQNALAMLQQDEQGKSFIHEFRVAGGNGKAGWENTAFKYGEKWNIERLARAVGVEWNAPRLKPAKTWTQEQTKPQKERKFLNQRVYLSTLERCKKEVREGHRYTSCMALTVLAYKCGIPKDQLRNDLEKLDTPYNDNAKTRFYVSEIKSAIKMYNKKAIRTTRYQTEQWLGFEFNHPRRNGRTQAVHLGIARAIRSILHPDGCTKKEIVQRWRQLHPQGRKIDCERATGLSRHTVLKWWNDPC